ncbi:16S rRNA (guanine(966)-N(2))-methyltransferase RsmD [Billgrantia diversa]|uniref:16S rRNA (guanine(966)-N(2))-methyltransferase RsmD n=1 Tax=Halomonas sp. MCCC 1A13316 TaxID=2733487 RepID=UPI0018A609DC|nr:16S rRNA (guanine(966)-N(2))-methyltransferase RsmD [Halomonas sp. MCCC 1A13316]QOR37493.1 16S rRNA (guanine(966)-N(2))-methyltransferase RsmD [Halomonas sp. MCCC 1A13316]
MTRRRPPSRSRSGARSPQGSGRLRIIGGEFRRRLLPVLDSPGLRPTPDRVRETLFNWLAAATPGARVLDLFAGTGALGLEALSRGAATALFIERDGQVARALVANLQTLGTTERGQVLNVDALALLAAGPAGFAPFTLVFLDPPFRQGLAEPCCERLEQGWLAPDAWVYLEVETSLEIQVPANWSLHREVCAGDSTGRLYRRLAASGS